RLALERPRLRGGYPPLLDAHLPHPLPAALLPPGVAHQRALHPALDHGDQHRPLWLALARLLRLQAGRLLERPLVAVPAPARGERLTVPPRHGGGPGGGARGGPGAADAAGGARALAP